MNVQKVQVEIMKTDNIKQHQNKINVFLEGISGYGYELKESDNRVTDSGYTSFITFYQKFETDPYEELNKRMQEAAGD